jgi:two-component system nitrate/nitrite response regulator NarL
VANIVQGVELNTVVVVDDQAVIRKALRRLFKAAGGFEVCGEASSGMEAIELAQELKPDLIVLDLCMPGLNGLETAHQLKGMRLPSRVVLYSLNAESIFEKDAAAAGVAAVVSKAEGVETLIAKARMALDKTAA